MEKAIAERLGYLQRYKVLCHDSITNKHILISSHHKHRVIRQRSQMIKNTIDPSCLFEKFITVVSRWC